MLPQNVEHYENGNVGLEVHEFDDKEPIFWIKCHIGLLEFDLKDFSSLLELLMTFYAESINVEKEHRIIANAIGYHTIVSRDESQIQLMEDGTQFVYSSKEDNEKYLNAAKLAVEYMQIHDLDTTRENADD